MAHILLVDDSVVLRDSLERALRRRGHDVSTAGNGDDALNQLVNCPTIDLVITDILMPGKEGVELIGDISRRFPRTPVMAMSGGGRTTPDGYLRLAEAAGAAAVLAKPFDLREFLAHAERLLSFASSANESPARAASA